MAYVRFTRQVVGLSLNEFDERLRALGCHRLRDTTELYAVALKLRDGSASAREDKPSPSLIQSATTVPRLAEQMACLFVPRTDADSTLGDLEDKYRRYSVRYGARFAVLWYWWQVGSLIGPRLRDMLLWLGGLAGLKKALDWIGRLGGS
jgi:hypothetical protein